jgi:hypothetical protein
MRSLLPSALRQALLPPAQSDEDPGNPAFAAAALSIEQAGAAHEICRHTLMPGM